MIFICRITASRGLVNISGSSCGGNESKKALRERKGLEREGVINSVRMTIKGSLGLKGGREGKRNGGRKGERVPSVKPQGVTIADSAGSASPLIGACLGKEGGTEGGRDGGRVRL